MLLLVFSDRLLAVVEVAHGLPGGLLVAVTLPEHLVLDGAVVESDSMVAAGAIVTQNKVVKSGELWAGAPAKKMRDMTPEEIAGRAKAAPGYGAEARIPPERAGRPRLQKPCSSDALEAALNVR